MRVFLIGVTLAALLIGCTGMESSEPPIVGIRNMYNQPRYDTQERQPFFADQRSMRPEVEGTVSRESAKYLSWDTGRTAKGDAWIPAVPAQLVKEAGGVGALLSRGQGRFNIYCAPCHGLSGDGKGMVSRRAQALGDAGLIAPTFHDDRLRHIPDGQLYATITNGVRNMPSYAHNIPMTDRWAIVQYVRALQLSQMPANTEQPQ